MRDDSFYDYNNHENQGEIAHYATLSSADAAGEVPEKCHPTGDLQLFVEDANFMNVFEIKFQKVGNFPGLLKTTLRGPRSG